MKRYTLYLLLGVVAGMVISSIFRWFGLLTPGQAYGKLLTLLFGEPGGVNSVIMLLFSGVLVVLIMVGGIQLSKWFEKRQRPSS